MNRFSLYDHNKVDERHRRVQFNNTSITDKWNAYYDVHVVNALKGDESEHAKLFYR